MRASTRQTIAAVRSATIGPRVARSSSDPAHQGTGMIEMDLIGQGDAGAPTAPIAEVARDPDGLDPCVDRRFQDPL